MDPMTSGFFQTPQTNFNGPKPLLRFYTEAVEIPGETVKQGRPIYENRDFVAIINPGSRDEVVRIAKDKAKQDPYVAHAYKVWKDTQEQPSDGTPLEQVPFLNPALVKELKALNIHSLEALAALPDAAKQRFMGANEFQAKAKAFLASAADSAHATHLQSELNKRDNEISMLKAEIEKINARFEEATRKAVA